MVVAEIVGACVAAKAAFGALTVQGVVTTAVNGGIGAAGAKIFTAAWGALGSGGGASAAATTAAAASSAPLICATVVATTAIGGAAYVVGKVMEPSRNKEA